MPENAKLIQQVIDASFDLLFLVDPTSGSILTANKQAQEQLGYSQQEFSELQLSSLFHGDANDHEKWLRVITQNQWTKIENCLLEARAGEAMAVRVIAGNVQVSSTPYLIMSAQSYAGINIPSGIWTDPTKEKVKSNIQADAILRKNAELEYAHTKLELAYKAIEKEVERRKQAEERLKRISTLDGLTGISNRRHFDEFFAQEWKRGAREQYSIALILLDIDFFKRYNDTYGHQAGDDCLVKVSQIMNGAVHRPSDLCARYGGEEFTIILPNTQMNSARKLAKTIRLKIEATQIEHSSSDVSQYVTASLGVSAKVPKANSSYNSLIQAADKALYQAKHCGRNQIHS